MIVTDTSERGLESLIVAALVGETVRQRRCEPQANSEGGVAYGGLATCKATRRITTGRMRSIWRSCSSSGRSHSPMPYDRPEIGDRWPATAESSWLDCKVRSPSEGSSMCCATGSATVRLTSTSSTAHHRQGIRWRGSASSPTSSASRGSCNTARTRPGWRSIWSSSSTACRSPPSS